MDNARSRLLNRVMTEVAAHGLADRSLREIAESIGSSHRMLLYHFGSRDGLVTAVVETVETNQRDLLIELSANATDAADLMMALWHRVSSPELAPFVRLFFECVAATGGRGLTESWLDSSTAATENLGLTMSEEDVTLGIAVTRGLLIDVLATGNAAKATSSFKRFVDLWQHGQDKPPARAVAPTR